MASEQLKKMMARKMARDKTGHTFYRTDSKETAHKIYRAMRDKKKIPKIDYPKSLRRDDKAYRKMPMDKFLKKYPEWKI